MSVPVATTIAAMLATAASLFSVGLYAHFLHAAAFRAGNFIPMFAAVSTFRFLPFMPAGHTFKNPVTHSLFLPLAILGIEHMLNS